MRVAVIGLGSMGKRRLRLLKQIEESTEVIGVDANEARRREAETLYGIRTVAAIDDLPCDIRIAFVSTPPLSHASVIHRCLCRNMHVFTELNLVADGYAENVALAKEKGVVLFLSSTWLYRDEVRYIEDAVTASGSRCNYCYHVGQYLPDWHPWESYRSFFVGDKRTNGCREIMAIELPWLTRLFGEVTQFTVTADKMTALAIDYPDNYLIQFQHASGTKGTLAIDVVSRRAVRNLEVYGENLYVSWDGSPNGLFCYHCEEKEYQNVNLYAEVDRQAGYSVSIIENAYKKEILAFLKEIHEGTAPVYGFADDRKVLSLIDRIEAEGWNV